MKALVLAAALAAAPHPHPAPPPQLTAREAGEILQLLQSTQVQGNSVPETYRLMVLLSKISQAGAKK